MKKYSGELDREGAQKFMWNFLGHVACVGTQVTIKPIKTGPEETCAKLSILLEPEETCRGILEDFLYCGQPHHTWLGIRKIS